MDETKTIKHRCGCVHTLGGEVINLEACPKHRKTMNEIDQILKDLGYDRLDNDVI